MHNTFYIKEDAWNKILGYARTCYDIMKMEIGGMAVIIKDDEGKWIITDPAILKQEVSSVVCHLDKEELAKWYSEMATKYKDYIDGKLKYLWWHSHHDMTAIMSGTDWGTIRESDASVSLVVNNNGEHQLIYRGGDPSVEVECELIRINTYQEGTSLKEEIEKLVTKEQIVHTATSFKSLRNELSNYRQQTLLDESLFDSAEIKAYNKAYEVVDETELVADDIFKIELEIDQMIDSKEPYDKLHAFLLAKNKIYGKSFDIPSKKDYESGKIQTSNDLACHDLYDMEAYSVS